MVTSGWLRRFSNRLSAALLAKRHARRTETQRPQQAEILEDRSLMSVFTLFLPTTGELSIELESGEIGGDVLRTGKQQSNKDQKD